LRRIEAISDAIQAYYLATGKMPTTLDDIAPTYIGRNLLQDPWGNEFRYLPKPTENPDKYLVIGFAPDGMPDTDVFLSRPVQSAVTSGTGMEQTGGIEVID